MLGVDFAPDAAVAASCSADKSVRVRRQSHSLANCMRIARRARPTSRCACGARSCPPLPSSPSYHPLQVRVWDMSTRSIPQTLPDCHAEPAWGVAFDPTNGNRLVSVGDDKVRLIS